MSLGLRDARRAERRRRRARIVTFFAILGGLVLLGAFAYESGSRLAQVETDALRRDLDQQRRTIAALQQQLGQTEALRQQAEARVREWEARYGRDVPTGTARELFLQVQERLTEGLAPDRLKLVLRNATNGTKCDATQETRRFLLATPLARTGQTSVSFAGAIVVTGEGQSARAPDGAPQAWYDPALPVTIVAIQPGGGRTETAGQLPLTFSVVRGANEHRFLVTEADLRGFVNVTAERCDYP
ncbi:keratin [Elioraea rosea]|uniref:keratin n=1 Tax=Elioraea rosea TaxID=2492390 RepID=UPI00118300AE|nr:keratin [Elioraea rosea]